MQWNKHLQLEGQHAFLSASGYHWLNDSEEKLIERYENAHAKAKGTQLHQLASDLIKQKIKLPRTKQTLNRFVNDAISLRMESEVVLYYSRFCFGTVDAISFHKNILRISDYKSGKTPAKHEQLLIYAAYFCLEYEHDPRTIDEIILNIYQFDEIHTLVADPLDVLEVMRKSEINTRILEDLEGVYSE